MRTAARLMSATLVLALVAAASVIAANRFSSPATDVGARVPAALTVALPLGEPPHDVHDLRFRDVFKLPVGPKGLELTDVLKGLDGKRVRIVGYMVQQQVPSAGAFMLTPLPVASGDDDESFADDIPASVIFVTLPHGAATLVPRLPGLLKVTGTLRVGAHEIPGTERIAAARIELDDGPEQALLRVALADASSTRAAH
jgi:hypothetical protein